MSEAWTCQANLLNVLSLSPRTSLWQNQSCWILCKTSRKAEISTWFSASSFFSHLCQFSQNGLKHLVRIIEISVWSGGHSDLAW